MRFLLDEDLTPAIAEIARGLGLDVISVHEIDRRGYPDEEQLRFSASQQRPRSGRRLPLLGQWRTIWVVS